MVLSETYSARDWYMDAAATASMGVISQLEISPERCRKEQERDGGDEDGGGGVVGFHWLWFSFGPWLIGHSEIGGGGEISISSWS